VHPSWRRPAIFNVNRLLTDELTDVKVCKRGGEIARFESEYPGSIFQWQAASRHSIALGGVASHRPEDDGSVRLA
jgi:hypothetical protein